jgi:glutathione synthase/RimK-type ligase-like ATP-grasp enzyme
MIMKKRVLILLAKQNGPNDKSWNFFRDSVARSFGDDVEVTMGGLLDLTFVINERESFVYDRVRHLSLDDFDLVVFRSVHAGKYRDRTGACASYLRQKGIPYIDSKIAPNPASKYSAQTLRQAAGLKAIPSVFSSNAELTYMFENDLIPFGYPIVIKDVNGRKGRLNFIVHNKETAVKILSENMDIEFIVQRFIENEGDYRLLVMGDAVKLVIYRQAADGSHLNNTSQGASSSVLDPATLPAAIIEDALTAARLENLEVAGVDMMIERSTGEHYVIEVNSSPQLATGAVPELKLEAYAAYLRSLIKA